MALAQTSPFDPHLQDNVVFGNTFLQCGIVSLCFNQCHTVAFCIPSARREVSWPCDVVITKIKEQRIEKKLNIRPKPQQ